MEAIHPFSIWVVSQGKAIVRDCAPTLSLALATLEMYRGQADEVSVQWRGRELAYYSAGELVVNT